jgi:transcriptional regulator with XRE-family HTH domain
MEYDVSERIGARRRELGLTREEVARRTGSRPSHIEYLEESHAVPDKPFLGRLAETLGTTTAYLAGERYVPPGTGR